MKQRMLMAIVFASIGIIATGCIPAETDSAKDGGSGAVSGGEASSGAKTKIAGGNVDDPNDKTGVIITPGSKLKENK